MSSLTGNPIASTYQSLIKIADNSTVGSSLENLTDGLGNQTALWVANQVAAVSGSLTVSGSTLLSGSVTITGSLNVSSNIVGTLAGTASWASNAVTASFATTGSYILQAVSASFATTGSYITLAQTASYITTAQTASSVGSLTQSVRVTGSMEVSGSIILTATISFVLPTTASASPLTGSAYFNFFTNKLYAYNGTTWVTASFGA